MAEVIDVPAGVRIERILKERLSQHGKLYLCERVREHKPWVATSVTILTRALNNASRLKYHSSGMYKIIRRESRSPWHKDVIARKVTLDEVNEIIRDRGCFVVTREPSKWVIDQNKEDARLLELFQGQAVSVRCSGRTAGSVVSIDSNPSGPCTIIADIMSSRST
jgi:hypothetical protein